MVGVFWYEIWLNDHKSSSHEYMIIPIKLSYPVSMPAITDERLRQTRCILGNIHTV